MDEADAVGDATPCEATTDAAAAAVGDVASGNAAASAAAAAEASGSRRMPCEAAPVGVRTVDGATVVGRGDNGGGVGRVDGDEGGGWGSGGKAANAVSAATMKALSSAREGNDLAPATSASNSACTSSMEVMIDVNSCSICSRSSTDRSSSSVFVIRPPRAGVTRTRRAMSPSIASERPSVVATLRASASCSATVLGARVDEAASVSQL